MIAIQAEFTDYDLVPTRGVLKLIFEVSEGKQAEVFAKLGFPISGQSLCVGIVRIHEQIPLPNESEADGLRD